MHKYAIIGGSAGAVGAVEAIREVDSSGSIAVVSDESLSAYSRPMIGEYLSGEASLERIMYRTGEFWHLNKVETFGRRAVSIDLDDKYVKLDGEEKIGFEKLLIATGSKPFVTKIDGMDKDGVFNFNTLTDAAAVRAKIEEVERAVIIGGGLIGVCVAEALAKRGVEVTIVELKETILSLLLDSVASNIVGAAVQKKGGNIVTGHAVQRIKGRKDDNNKVEAVVLDNGEVIPCDIVIIAIGVSPCTELVRGTKIKTNKGIVVDRFMRTSVPDVYACGDVAEAYDFILDESRVLPQWPIAYLGGKVAGYNMAGENVQYPGGTVMSALKYFDIPVIAVGVTNPKDSDGCQVLASNNPSGVSYRKVVIKEGKIKGFILVSDIERAGVLFYLMSKGIGVDEFKEKLLSEDFGLVHLPKQLREIMLMESVRH